MLFLHQLLRALSVYAVHCVVVVVDVDRLDTSWWPWWDRQRSIGSEEGARVASARSADCEARRSVRMI